jgi:hypothetical protein
MKTAEDVLDRLESKVEDYVVHVHREMRVNGGRSRLNDGKDIAYSQVLSDIAALRKELKKEATQ